MPPFVLCNVTNCIKAYSCYRYLAYPEPQQLFNDFSTICHSENDHYYHMKVRPEDKIIELELQLKEIEQNEQNY